MKKTVFAKSAFSSFGALVVSSALTIASVILASYGLERAERSNVSEGKRVLEESLRRAALTCYSIEGKYPESLSYIEEKYGIIIDSSEYSVFYTIEASNIFPDITVLERED